jgi:hypothetical protein
VVLGIGLSRMFSMRPALAMSIGGGLGITLAWVSAPGVRQTTQRIDRAFFREAYDARVILQELARRVANLNGREELAALVSGQLMAALHPGTLAVYLLDSRGMLRTPEGKSDLPALNARWR